MRPTSGTVGTDAEKLDRKDTIAPAHSASFGQVLMSAEQDGVDRGALTQLFWLLNAHPRLLGHQRCLQNLLSMLSTPDFVDGVHDWGDTWMDHIPIWIAASAWAARQQGNASPALEEFVREPRNGHHHVLMRHGINRHPGAGAIWIRHHSDPDPSMPTASLAAPGRMFRLLQWHLFCSQAEARHSRCTLEQYLQYDLPSEWPAWPRPAAAVGLALRQFSYSRWDTLVEELPFETRLDDFANALVEGSDQLLKRHEDSEARQRIVALVSYFEDFKLYFEGRPAQRRRKGGGGSGGGRKGITGFVHFSSSPLVLFEPPEPDTGDEDVPSRNATRVHVHSDELTPQTIAELESLGIAPSEDLRPIMDLFPIEDRPGGIHGMWTMRQATEAAAQKDYWDKTQLTPLEVAALLNAVDTAQQERAEPIASHKDEAARLALKCMLVFGCTQEEARTIRTMLTTALDTQAQSDEGLVTRVVLVDSETGLCAGFALPAIGPRYTSRPPDSFSTNADAARPYLSLPDVTGLGPALLRYQRSTNGKIGGPVFHGAPEQLDARIKRLLATANQQLDAQSRPRLTTTKVSRKLPSLLSRAGLDEVCVAILCGDRRYESQARLHYTQHRTDDLTRAYAKAIRRVLTEAGCSIAPACRTDRQVANTMVGARLVVRPDELRRFVGALRTELTEAPPLTRSGRHRYHQAYLLYTLVMQGLLTGMRPSSQPDRLLAEVLAHCGRTGGDSLVASIVEKDDQYEARARPVAIPGRLKRQFGHIAAHAQSTWQWRPVELSIRSTTPAQQMLLDWADDEAKPCAQVVDAQWIASQLARFGLAAAANFTRAFLRTWLLRDRCAEQVVDAFLGHAGPGQNPSDMHGTFDFAHHLREFGARLDRMADELGLQPVRSKLADPEVSPSATPSPGA